MVNASKKLTQPLGCFGVILALAASLYGGMSQIVYGHFRGESVDEVRFTPDSRTLVGYGYLSTPEKSQGTLYAWDRRTGRLRWKKSNPNYFRHLDLSRDGRDILASTDNNIDIFDIQTGQPRAHFSLPNAHGTPAYFTKDNEHILLSPDGIHLEEREVSTHKTTRRLKTQVGNGAFALSPDRKRFVFYKGRNLVLRDFETEETLGTRGVPTDEGAYASTSTLRFLSNNLVCFGMSVWNADANASRPLNEEEDRIEAPDRSGYVTLEYRGGKNEHFPLGQLISYRKGQPDITLEGKTGW